MIVYLLREINERTIAYAEEWGPTPGSRMRLVEYDDLLRTDALEPATYIFSDLEVLSAAQSAIAKEAWRALAGSGRRLPLLNDPSLAASRFELLSRLHGHGINRYRAVRAKDFDTDLRFPVFVRYDNQHTGPLTPLLNSARELKRAVRYLRIRGHRLRNLLIVEYCDTSAPDGIFRKYAAFLVGDRVLPRHLFFSRYWMIKHGGPLDKAPMDAALESEKHDYLYGNPHEQSIRRIFRIAGIDFGRIDYGMLGGTPQVWEINSHPTITNLTPRLTKALEAIDHHETVGEPIPFSLESSLVKARRREHRLEAVYENVLAVMDYLTEARLTRPLARLARQILRYQ